MSRIDFPQRFKDKLENADKKFKAIISEIEHNFEEYLNTSKLEFFPEYNDHGIIHLNNVFKIQDKLITNESFDLLTPEDITVLIVATLSHDIGMHLNYESFQTLLQKATWKELWDDFLQKAKKYDDKKLYGLFGDNTKIDILPCNKQDFRTSDYLLIGEFLRINHHNLAEEILKEGFPILNGKYKFFSTQLKNESKLLAFSALLAKSHGVTLRNTFEQIEFIVGMKGNLVFAFNTHIIYLMVILRISDYFDILESRNPKIILGCKNFISQKSKFEYNKNTAIIDSNAYHKDQEAVSIIVEPEDSKTFIDLKELFASMQNELDKSWAILGEVYSRSEKSKFGISYRRIYSNIDDEKEFENTVEYVPKQITFHSDSNLLKLLIAPLYGKDPIYGVRELLQNAVDACKEYKIKNPNYMPRIDVTLTKDYFEIVDNGIGMNDEIIINYLLKAGASFRDSETWKKEFEDEEHHSKVERTGRFGVGLLAAFLFGDEIEVETKAYNSSIGYKFKTKLLEEQINIIKDNTLLTGTKIKIKIIQDTYDTLLKKDYDRIEWNNWYLLNDIEIYYNGKPKHTTINLEQYQEIPQNTYRSVKWAYDNNLSKQKLICNGFDIPKTDIKLKSRIDIPREYNYGYTVWKNYNTPTILIDDGDGKALLSLNREKFLINEFCFNHTLLQALCNDIFKKFLHETISKKTIVNNFYLKQALFLEKTWKNICKNGTKDYQKKIIYHKEGFTLLNSYSIEKNKITKLIFIEFGETEVSSEVIERLFEKLVKQDTSACVLFNTNSIDSTSNGFSYLFESLAQNILSLDKIFYIKSANIIMQKQKYPNVFKYSNTSIKIGLKDNLTTFDIDAKRKRGIVPMSSHSEDNSANFTRNYFLQEQPSDFILNELDEIKDLSLIVEVFLDDLSPKADDQMEYYFYNLMSEHFKDKENCWIPYGQSL